jgi:hypothetical protein
MWQRFVMIADIEFDESAQSGDAVQVVLKEPVMFQGTPERLDHGIGGKYVRLRKNPMQESLLAKLIDRLVEVLLLLSKRVQRGAS